MDLREQCLQKMLDEGLDFLPLRESRKLMESGIRLETEFSWVMNVEEISNYYELDFEELMEAHAEVFGEDDMDYLKIGNTYDAFNEFTHELCPAPTVTDLLGKGKLFTTKEVERLIFKVAPFVKYGAGQGAWVEVLDGWLNENVR